MKRSNFPSQVIVEMTNRCNLSCSVCPRFFVDDALHDMDIELWKKIIDEIAEHEVTLIPFWRGESAMHENFTTMMTYARSAVNQIYLSTNGILSSTVIESFVQADFVSVSCHVHESISFLKEMWKLKQTKHLTKPMLQASVVEGELYDNHLVELAGPYADVVRIYKKHSDKGKFGSIGGRKGRKFCERLNNDIVIDCAGNVSRCCHNWKTDAPMNILDDTIENVWNSPKYEKIRKQYPDKICQQCDQWDGVTVGKTIDTTHMKAG
jgi:hypothetical protein